MPTHTRTPHTRSLPPLHAADASRSGGLPLLRGGRRRRGDRRRRRLSRRHGRRHGPRRRATLRVERVHAVEDGRGTGDALGERALGERALLRVRVGVGVGVGARVRVRG